MATNVLELKIPMHASLAQPAQMKQAVVSYLLDKKLITMPDALSMLSAEDQAWLMKTLIQDAQENLFLATHITELSRQQRFWQQYQDRLGDLFEWHEHWSPYHNQLLAILRTISRRYTPQTLSAEQVELLQRLTLRLHEKRLYREDIFAITQALLDSGLDPLLDLSPIADSLFQSYTSTSNASAVTRSVINTFSH